MFGVGSKLSEEMLASKGCCAIERTSALHAGLSKNVGCCPWDSPCNSHSCHSCYLLYFSMYFSYCTEPALQPHHLFCHRFVFWECQGFISWYFCFFVCQWRFIGGCFHWFLWWFLSMSLGMYLDIHVDTLKDIFFLSEQVWLNGFDSVATFSARTPSSSRASSSPWGCLHASLTLRLSPGVGCLLKSQSLLLDRPLLSSLLFRFLLSFSFPQQSSEWWFPRLPQCLQTYLKSWGL